MTHADYNAESIAREVLATVDLLGLGVVELMLYSKTFLARLCEQAERYDGKQSSSSLDKARMDC